MSLYHVRKDEMLRYLGYAGQCIPEHLDAQVDDIISQCETSSKPAFVYRMFPIDDTQGDIRLVGSSLILPGNDIYNHLKGASQVALMACTLGLANEIMLKRIQAKSATDALMYGAAGSSLVESVADVAEAEIVAEGAKMGLHTNWRYSPGYGDLPLSVQDEFVRTLDAQRSLGITVTPSNLLIPSKSVTAIIGLFSAPQEHTKRSCKGCAIFDYCSLRKAGAPCWR
ncbi:MAG: vitamin B12 dependent methionine synthase [Eggerthellaceae bacterium]|nr:vitamin B12 dependent methionine synthase [Eggerthellaceae bacterium]